MAGSLVENYFSLSSVDDAAPEIEVDPSEVPNFNILDVNAASINDGRFSGRLSGRLSGRVSAITEY